MPFTAEEFKEKFKAGDLIDDDLELTQEIVEKLGIHPSVAKEVFSRLWQNEIKTWGNLLALKSEEAVDAAGGEERSGTTIWKAIQRYKQRSEPSLDRGRSQRPNRALSVEDAPVQPDFIRELLAKTKLSADCTHYELPYFNHHDRRIAEHLRRAGVRARVYENKFENVPDLLTSSLDRPVVSLCEMTYRDTERRLSLTVQGKRHVKVEQPRIGRRFYVALVGPSGAGKTRFLFERAYSKFACLLWPSPFNGSRDMFSLLGGIGGRMLPSERVEEARTELMRGMRNILGIRALVLEHLQKVVKGFSPRHWLAVQMAPAYFLGLDLFQKILDVLRGRELADAEDLYLVSGMEFVAIDECQILDSYWSKTFISTSGNPRSALGPVLDALTGMGTGVVLSGTGLNVVSQIEIIGSSLGKSDFEIDKRVIYGVVNSLDVPNLRQIFQERGYDCRDLSDEVLETFRGRPRFGMRLLEGLLVGKSAETIHNELLQQVCELLEKASTKFLDVPGTTKTLLGELKRATIRMILKATGGITVGGETALEIGICNIVTKQSESKRARLNVSAKEQPACSFEIDEPLIIEAIEARGLTVLEDVTTEDASTLGDLLEEFVALKAEDILSVLSTDIDPNFRGPWKLPQPGPDRLRGVKVNNGEEVAALKSMIHHIRQGGKGRYMVFPGPDFGGDVIICAPNDNRYVLVSLIQCKARPEASTPEALRSLQFPYHTNRGDTDKRAVPDRYKAQLAELEGIMRSNDVRVAFVVVKYPARSLRNTPPVVVETCEGWGQHRAAPFPVLNVILVGGSAPKLLNAEVCSILERLEKVKSMT